MQPMKSALTIAALVLLLLCFRHWPAGSSEGAGTLQALTQLPLLSLKRVVGARCSAIALLPVCSSTACAVLPCTDCADAGCVAQGD